MWKTTDTISSGLCFTSAGSLSSPEAGAPEEPSTQPRLRRPAQAPWVSHGIGDPSAFPSRKYHSENRGAKQLTGCVTLLYGIWCSYACKRLGESFTFLL